MNRTVAYRANCWECSDFNFKNTMGEECESNRHVFCDKSLEEHDKQIRADVIDEFVKEMKKEPFSDYVMNIVCHIAEELKEK